MVVPNGLLASSSFTLEDIAAYIGRNVVTARKWFDGRPGVISLPRGRQRPTLLIPASTLTTVLKEMGFPDDMVRDLIEHHKQQKQQKEAAAATAAVAASSPASASIRYEVQLAKSDNLGKSTKTPKLAKTNKTKKGPSSAGKSRPRLRA